MIKYLPLAFLCLAVFCAAIPSSSEPVASTPPSAPQTYDDWMKIAQQPNVPQNVPQTPEQRRANLRARGEAFENAARFALDAEKKYAAWMNAGATYERGGDFAKSQNAYAQALAVPGTSETQRAQAAINGLNTRVAAALAGAQPQPNWSTLGTEYSALLDLPGITPPQKANIQTGLATTLLQQGKVLEAAHQYEQAALPDSAFRHYNLNQAVSTLLQAPPSPEALAAIERVFPIWNAEKIPDAATRQLRARTAEESAGVLSQWGDALSLQGASARAVAVWKEAFDNANVSTPARFNLAVKLANEQIKLSQFEDALATWGKVAGLNGLTFPQQRERAYGRANVYFAQNNPAKARDELQAITTLAGVTPDVIARTWMDIGISHKRERDALKKDSKIGPATAAEKAAQTAFETAISTPGVSPVTKADAILERAQIDVEAKRFDAAHQRIAAELDALKTTSLAASTTLRTGNAKLYRIEKKFPEAMDELVLTAQPSSKGPQFDPNLQNLALDILRETLVVQNWDAARKVLAGVKRMGLRPQQELIYQSQIEIGSGKTTEAKALLEQLAKLPLTAQEKKDHETLVKFLPPQ